MRVLHVLNHLGAGSGITQLAVELALGQRRLGHEVAVVSGPGPFGDTLAAHGVGWWPARLRPPIRDPEALPLRPARRLVDPWLLASLVNNLAALPVRVVALRRALKAFRPEVVHAHMVAAALLARALQPLFGYKLVCTVHNPFDRQHRLMAGSDRVIAVSAAVADRLVANGFPADRVRTVRNGVCGSMRRGPFVARNLGLSRPALVTISGLHPRKAVDDVVAAMALLVRRQPSASLSIAGSGPDRPALQEAVERAGIEDNVTFLGWVDDPRPLLAEADVFVFASRDEPFGLVITEAREFGCAVVATEVGGIPEALDGRGILVPPGDPAAIAEAVGRLLEDPAVLEAVKAEARCDLDKFSVQRMASDTVAVYEELLTSPPAGRTGPVAQDA